MNLNDLHTKREALLDEIKELNRKLAEKKEAVDALDQEIMDLMLNIGLQPGEYMVIGGKRYTLEDKPVYNVEDWDATWDWVIKNKAPFILQKRLVQKAVDELIDSGCKPDGVVSSIIRKLKVTVK